MFDLVIELLKDLVGILNVYIPFILICNLIASMLWGEK